MKKWVIYLVPLFLYTFTLKAQNQTSEKPRILISTDIGGTDPDDNQSMIHFLMYSNLFDTEGLISSPSYGKGSREDILEMIDLYAADWFKLRQHASGYPSPDYLRSITKQGRRGAAPFKGFTTATEGSSWIIKCARKKSTRPLWVLVWGGLEDLAQALHDAPDIRKNIRVYWIGGPNKKWSANAYAYIAQNFPNLWFIENNASYRGLFWDKKAPERLKNDHYYENYIKGAGHMGQAFKNYYSGDIKMGDTPSLLYMMNGNPNQPLRESWGGSFKRIKYSTSVAFDDFTTNLDTVPVYSIVVFHFTGPVIQIPKDSSCFTLTVHSGIGTQKWAGYYLGNGKYGVRYAPKRAENLSYTITSDVPGFKNRSGQLTVQNKWPGRDTDNSYPLGDHWFTDRSAPDLFVDEWQGAATVLKWRSDILMDWAKRWKWLR